MNKYLVLVAWLGLLAISLLAPCPTWANQTDEEQGVAKILGGRGADIRNWPWVVAIVHAGVENAFRGQFCGGTLISGQWVVTAAHCLTDNEGRLRFSPQDLHVVSGRTNLLTAEGDRIPASRLVVHPQYNPGTEDSDLALIQLSRTPAADTVWGVLPLIPPGDPSGLTTPGAMAYVAGWGALGPRGPFPHVLQETQFPIVSQAALILVYPPPFFTITNNMIGAGPGDGTRDTCQGDSGGPLMVRDSGGNPFLAGITSWGLQCGTAGIYGVYTRMANYCEWVKSVSDVGDCGSGGGGGGCTAAPGQGMGGDWLILAGVVVFWAVWRRFGSSRPGRPESRLS